MLNTHRRLAMATVFAIALSGLSYAASADDFGPASVTGAAQSFRLGSVQITALHDAQYVVHNDASVFGVDAGPAAVVSVLKANNLPDDRVTLSVNALLVRSGKRVILIDSGLGPKANGSLTASLTAAAVSPSDITDVLITHSHGDHVGGLVTSDGKLAFPNATIRMSKPEWDWMKSQPDSADLVKVIDGHVQTFAPGAPIAPSVTSVPLGGHTPGHVGYEIAAGKQRLLDIGDLAHSSVLSLKKPEWTTKFDSDSDLAKATRKATFARLAKSHELVFAPHFPYPGVGHIVVDGNAYAWVPQIP